MKKLLVLSTLLLTLSIAACGNSTPKDTSKDDNPISEDTENEESEELEYLGYPDDPEGYNAPKFASFTVKMEISQSGDKETNDYYSMIINNDEIYVNDLNSDCILEYYAVGSYKYVDVVKPQYEWQYDIYYNTDDPLAIEAYGAGWHHYKTNHFEYLMALYYAQYLFNYSLLKDNVSTLTGKTRTIDGDICIEREMIYPSGQYVYYSESKNIFKGCRAGDDENYTMYYISSYSTEEKAIPNKPGSDILNA